MERLALILTNAKLTTRATAMPVAKTQLVHSLANAILDLMGMARFVQMLTSAQRKRMTATTLTEHVQIRLDRLRARASLDFLETGLRALMLTSVRCVKIIAPARMADARTLLALSYAHAIPDINYKEACA